MTRDEAATLYAKADRIASALTLRWAAAVGRGVPAWGDDFSELMNWSEAAAAAARAARAVGDDGALREYAAAVREARMWVDHISG